MGCMRFGRTVVTLCALQLSLLQPKGIVADAQFTGKSCPYFLGLHKSVALNFDSLSVGRKYPGWGRSSRHGASTTLRKNHHQKAVFLTEM